MAQTVTYSLSGNVAKITITRPPVNALNLEVVRDLISTLKQAAGDERAHAVIIASGTPRRFCAGLDLNELQGRSTVDIHKLLTTLYIDLYKTQAQLGKPSIAAISGAARGAGMTVAISCDVILAQQDATFGYPEIDIGLIPGIHFAHLPRIIGKHRAFELLFSGRSFSADEAFALGLLSRVVSEGNVIDEAEKLARVFSAKSPTVMRLAKAAFIRAADLGYQQSVEHVVEAFCTIAATEDAKEGLQAFADKRTPNWLGVEQA